MNQAVSGSMNQRTRTVVAALLGALAGLAVGCLGMYYLLIQPFLVAWSQSGYSSAVAEAKLTAIELRLLRERERDIQTYRDT